jgi:hypothetical protein
MEMKKFIINWDAGYGASYEVVEAATYDDALEMAVGAWEEEAQSNADYDAVEWTQELEDDLC